MTHTGLFRRTAAAAVVALLAGAAFAAAALAHVERTSYWPDPRPDTTVKPAAGGAPPKVRSLFSALPRKSDKRARKAKRFTRNRSYKAGDKRGKVRVVCQSTSLRRVTADIRLARTKGYRDRPTQPLSTSARSGRSNCSRTTSASSGSAGSARSSRRSRRRTTTTAS